MQVVEMNVSTGVKITRPMTAEEIAAIPQPTQEQLLQQFIAAMEYHYDLVAQRKQYDNRLTCALRAGYAGPFQTEGQTFAVWMDTCNLYGYEQMDRVLNGQRPMPTVSGLIAELPVAPW